MADEADDRVAAARQLIDDTRYLTMATADAAGRPWVTPVWFAHQGYAEYLWVSRPGARHSLNIAVRPQVSFVVFDSTAPVGQGRGVYVEARAEQVADARIDWALAVFSAGLEADGGTAWRRSAVAGPAPFRLYHARSTAHQLLDAHDHRVPVDPSAPTTTAAGPIPGDPASAG